MLILTAKHEDEILIGGNIVLKVFSNPRGLVSLGFAAPPEIQIVRSKVATKSELRTAYEKSGMINYQNRSHDLG